MVKNIFTIIVLFICVNINAQNDTLLKKPSKINHLVGIGIGYSTFEPPIYLNYQFNYRFFNVKTKIAILPFGLRVYPWSFSNDYYLGVKSAFDKKNIFALNFGISFLYPKKDKYELEIKQQINPIVNFEYSYRFKNCNRLFFDIDYSTYKHSESIGQGSASKYADFTNSFLNIQFGYCFFLLKQKKKQW